jgi:hypothetical protein
MSTSQMVQMHDLRVDNVLWSSHHIYGPSYVHKVSFWSLYDTNLNLYRLHRSRPPLRYCQEYRLSSHSLYFHSRHQTLTCPNNQSLPSSTMAYQRTRRIHAVPQPTKTISPSRIHIHPPVQCLPHLLYPSRSFPLQASELITQLNHRHCP